MRSKFIIVFLRYKFAFEIQLSLNVCRLLTATAGVRG